MYSSRKKCLEKLTDSPKFSRNCLGWTWNASGIHTEWLEGSFWHSSTLSRYFPSWEAAQEHVVLGVQSRQVTGIISLWLGDFSEPEMLSRLHPCDWGKLYQLLPGYQISIRHLFKQCPGWQMLEPGYSIHVQMNALKPGLFSLAY